jgi:cell division protein ZapB
MQSELDALEQKLLQLVQLNQRLRAENQLLRQHVAAALNEQRKRQDKIDQAAQRLERILDQLPAETP